MKIKTLFSVAFLLIASLANAFTIHYYNKDSKNYKMEVKSQGSTQTVEFTSSTTGDTSIQTSADVVEINTSCGWIKVKNSAKISIKDGCITVE